MQYQHDSICRWKSNRVNLLLSCLGGKPTDWLDFEGLITEVKNLRSSIIEHSALFSASDPSQILIPMFAGEEAKDIYGEMRCSKEPPKAEKEKGKSKPWQCQSRLPWCRQAYSIMSTYARPHSPTVKAPTKGNGKASSFVLKLNTMVNGAPDDVVSVSDT